PSRLSVCVESAVPLSLAHEILLHCRKSKPGKAIDHSSGYTTTESAVRWLPPVAVHLVPALCSSDSINRRSRSCRGRGSWNIANTRARQNHVHVAIAADPQQLADVHRHQSAISEGGVQRAIRVVARHAERTVGGARQNDLAVGLHGQRRAVVGCAAEV